MDFGALAPEINTNRMFRGSGAAPLQAAAAAWGTLADALYAAATAMGSIISELPEQAWQGSSATSMLEAATLHREWLVATADTAAHSAAQAKEAAAAYGAALRMTVQPQVIQANRRRFAALVGTNQLAQKAHAIVDAEAAYSRMWAQNAQAMYRYASASARTTHLRAFTAPRTDCATAAMAAPESRWSVAIPAALHQLASPTSVWPASPPWQLKTVVDSLTSETPTLAPCLASLSALVSRVTDINRPGDNDGRATHAGTQGQPVLVQAWFSGSPTVPITKLRGPGGAPTAPRHTIGPAATIGTLSVPRAWLRSTPENSARAKHVPPSRSHTSPPFSTKHRKGQQHDH